jgi:Cytochrome c oxidase caa3 assembly factor (Caa3_CtaG)
MSAALAISIVAVAAAYVWRWRGATGSVSSRQMGAFLGGIVALWIAVGSPLAHMDHAHLTAHMLQHLIIMTIAAPLILIGEPVLVLLGGDRPRRSWSVHPVLCWLAGTAVVIVWHVPALVALDDPALSLPGDHAVRRAVGVPGVLRTGHLPPLRVDARPFGPSCDARGSGTRRRAHVVLGHDRVSRAGRRRHGQAALVFNRSPSTG